MAIVTDLSTAPYHDDYDKNDNFHRILFRPGYAVQARELTQLQTIMQGQIERFANDYLVDGTIVSGGGLITDNTNYVKLRDKDANNRVLLISDFFVNDKIANVVIEGQTSGMTGKLVHAVGGDEYSAPDYFTIYCHYTNSGANNATKAFAPGETLIFRTAASNTFVVAANVIGANATGMSLKANIDEGICYHKGNFIRIPPQSIIVGKYTTLPYKNLGLTTVESIVDSNQDSSLLDNSTGSSNYAAPGADRLKIVPTLTAHDLNYANTENFFSIALIMGGSIEQRSKDSKYAAIGKMIGEKLFDTFGNYAVEPFNLRIREHLRKDNSLGRYTLAESGNTEMLVCEVEKGAGYVNGEKIELQASRFLDFDKAIDTLTRQEARVGQNIGNYVNVKEFVGDWDFANIEEVELYDTVQRGISDKNFGNQAIAGQAIGTANIRGIQWDAGVAGTADGKYRMYLFDIEMYPNKSFADVRSIVKENGAPYNSMADVVLDAGIAKVQETNKNTLVFPLGQKASKTLTDCQFIYRAKRDLTIDTQGIGDITDIFATITPHAGGSEGLAITGSLTNVGERDFILVNKNATAVTTTPHTGMVTAYTSNNNVANLSCSIVGTGTNFTSTYQVGDLIQIGTNQPTTILSIADDTHMRVANTDLGTASGLSGAAAAHKTVFPPGYVFDLSSNGTITATNDSITINLQQGSSGVSGNLASQCAATVYFNMLRSSASPTLKTLQDSSNDSTKNRFVKLDLSTHSANTVGPWPLGVSDAFKLVKVYKGAAGAVTENDRDVTSQFQLDSGMKDAMYDTAYLELKEDSSLSLSASDGLLVKFNYFGRDRSAGIGFLSVDSYPIDDVDVANTVAITTQEIPIFTSPTNGIRYDLRDHIDMRPIRANTCEPKTTAAAAPVNPTFSNTTFSLTSSGAYMPTPDESFQADYEYYLPRRDRVVITKGGTFQVIKGVPDETPQTPTEIAGSMTLGTLVIPPYPSLSPYVAKQYDRSDYAVRLTLENNRRYTMKDLRAVEQRVKNLEYYSTMNLLETATKNKQLSSENAIDRYKNGFFVDGMESLVNVDTSNPYFRAAIDQNNGVLRPTFTRADIKMEIKI